MATVFQLFKDGHRKIAKKTWLPGIFIELTETPDKEYYSRVSYKYEGKSKIGVNTDLLIGTDWFPFDELQKQTISIDQNT